MAKKNDDVADDLFPKGSIDRVIAPIHRYLQVETTSGIILIVATIIALIWANFAEHSYNALWELPLGISIGSFNFTHSLHWWVNDALMTLFFFVVGLEVKGEIVNGELSNPKMASLPIVAALGGMIFPAIIYLMLCPPGTSAGWGVPMATDIAFVVGCMAILGNRIPKGLHVMILTLAIADDIGAIIVIALGYSGAIDINYLFMALGLLVLTNVFFRVGIRNLIVHFLLGVVIWFAFVNSGIHATLAGVALGLLTPAIPWVKKGAINRYVHKMGDFLSGGPSHDDSCSNDSSSNNNPSLNKEEQLEVFRTLQKCSRESVSMQDRLLHALHPWVSYIIMPLFALANAGVIIQTDSFSGVTYSIGLGLIIGKPLGIFLFSFIAVKLRIAKLPAGVSFKMLLGGGALAGIGFTMSLFVSELAFVNSRSLLDGAKIGILFGSFISAIIGMVYIYFVSKSSSTEK